MLQGHESKGHRLARKQRGFDILAQLVARLGGSLELAAGSEADVLPRMLLARVSRLSLGTAPFLPEKFMSALKRHLWTSRHPELAFGGLS